MANPPEDAPLPFNLTDDLFDQISGDLKFRDLLNLHRTCHGVSIPTGRTLREMEQRSVRHGNNVEEKDSEGEDCQYSRRYMLSLALEEHLRNPDTTRQYVMVGSLNYCDGTENTFKRAEMKVEPGGGAQLYVSYDHHACGSLISQEEISFDAFDADSLVAPVRYGFTPNRERDAMSAAFLAADIAIEFDFCPAFTTMAGDIELRIHHNERRDTVVILRDSTRAAPHGEWPEPLQNWLPAGGCWRLSSLNMPEDGRPKLIEDADDEDIFYRESSPRAADEEAYDGGWDIRLPARNFLNGDRLVRFGR